MPSKSESPRAIAPSLRKRQVRIAVPIALLLCLLPYYWASFRAPAVGTMHDDGIYLVTAKALAEGKGYHIISLPDEPKQTKYPIGFPLLLAMVWKVFPNFPNNVPVLKLVPIACLLAWLGMGVVFARRWGKLNWEAALWIAFFCAGTRWAVFLGSNFMSDLLFGALMLAGIHYLLSLQDSPHPMRTALLAGLCCAAAYNVRTAALAAIVGGIVALSMKKQWRLALVFGAIPVCAIAAWMAWQQGGPVFSNPIYAYYTSQNYKDWNLVTAQYGSLESSRSLRPTSSMRLFTPYK